MKLSNLLFILLLLFLAKTTSIQSQTQITPLIGYELNRTSAVQNYTNRLHKFRVRDKHEFPLRTYIIGFRASRYLSTNWLINTGFTFSTHHFDADVIPNTGYPGWMSHQEMNLKRLRFLLGLGHEIEENLIISLDLTVNHLTGYRQIVFIHENGELSLSSPMELSSRLHLGIQLGLNWRINNIVLRPHFEFGFWNLKNRTKQTATKPITGFGVSLGYLFEW